MFTAGEEGLASCKFYLAADFAEPFTRVSFQIMWPHPEYFLPEDYHEVKSWMEFVGLENFNDFIRRQELPHKRIVRNVRKLLESKPSRLELESILTALPRGSRPKRNYDEDSD